jgi:HAE1 family hydrophobic/amphiphilic exporter-1
MLGVTFFGLIFTPVFYVVVRKFAKKPHEYPSPRRSPAE